MTKRRDVADKDCTIATIRSTQYQTIRRHRSRSSPNTWQIVEETSIRL